MNYSYRYQFPINGQYALADAFYRNIWLTVDDESMAHRIKRTFFAKVNLLVMNLSKFENAAEEEISVDNCLTYHIPHTNNVYYTIPNINNASINSTINNYPCSDPLTLTKQPVFNLLTRERTYELHDQLLLYRRLLEIQVDADPGPNKFYHEYTQFWNDVDKIFSVEIHIDTLEAKLADLCRMHWHIQSHAPGWVLDTIRQSFYE